MSQDQPLQKPPGYSDENVQIQRPPQATPSNLPPVFYPYNIKKRKSNCCCCTTCYFCVCISLALLLLLLLCLGTFFCAWYRPNLPGFTLKSFRFTNFNVTTNNTSKHNDDDDGGRQQPTITTRLTLDIVFTNANKNFKFVYDKIAMVAVNDDTGLILGEVVVPGFTQGANNVTTLKFLLKGNQTVSIKDSIKLAQEFKDKSLKLTLEASTGIGMQMNNGWNIQPIWVKLSCGDTTLKQLEYGQTPTCKVYVFNLHA